MGVREALNSHRRTSLTSGVVLVAIAVGVAVWSLLGKPNDFSDEKAWFSDDDGKTWFKDDPKKITPFDHNGKQAVMCFVYTNDNGKTMWVAYLMRHQLGWREKLEQARKNNIKNPRDSLALAMTPMEVKRPGQSDWYPVTDPRGEAITDPREMRAPNGSRDNVTPVDP